MLPGTTARTCITGRAGNAGRAPGTARQRQPGLIASESRDRGFRSWHVALSSSGGRLGMPWIAVADDGAGGATLIAHVGAGGHVEDLAGDVGGAVRGEEGHRLGDVGRARQVAEKKAGYF